MPARPSRSPRRVIVTIGAGGAGLGDILAAMVRKWKSGRCSKFVAALCVTGQARYIAWFKASCLHCRRNADGRHSCIFLLRRVTYALLTTMGLRTGRSDSQSGSTIGPTDRYKSGSRPSAWCDLAPGTVSSRCARGASIWASRKACRSAWRSSTRVSVFDGVLFSSAYFSFHSEQPSGCASRSLSTPREGGVSHSDRCVYVVSLP